MKTLWLSDEDFKQVYGLVPRFNLDLLIRSEKGVLLVQRSIEPHIGCWHLPGGTVYKDELLTEAALRIAKKETGLEGAMVIGCIGYMEFPHEKRGGLDVHTISLVLEIGPSHAEVRPDGNAKAIAYHTEIPTPMIPEHKKFLEEKGILTGSF